MASGGSRTCRGCCSGKQEAGYLAGYLAGLVETETVARLKDGNIMSTVGSSDEASEVGYIAGFRAGAKASDPKVKLLQLVRE